MTRRVGKVREATRPPAVAPKIPTESQIATYRNALKEAREQFKMLTERQIFLQVQLMATESEIMGLRRTITALAAICSEPSAFDDLGLTDAVKQVMVEEPELVTTTEVTQKLKEIGFALTSHKNAQASVHNVLQRLCTRELIQRVEDDGRTVRWKGPKYDAILRKVLK